MHFFALAGVREHDDEWVFVRVLKGCPGDERERGGRYNHESR